MPGSIENNEEALTGRPRWKNYPEAIKFILRRTIPEHPIPRGKYRQLYPQVAKEVNDRFDFGERKADAKGIKYVTEKYGSDPVFGNRKMQVVHPAKGRASTREKKSLLRAKRAVENGGGNLILCPHCEGNGFVETGEAAGEEGDMLQDSQGATTDPPSPTFRGGYGPMHPGPANPVIGTNSYQGLQPSTGDPSFMIAPTPMAHMPNAYHGPSELGQAAQPTSHYQSTAAPVMGNNAYGDLRGTVESNQAQPFQNTRIWNGMGDMMAQESQNGQQFNLAVQENFPAPKSSTDQFGWQNTPVANVNAMVQPGHEQMGQRSGIPQNIHYTHIDPSLRPGTVGPLLPSGKSNATPQMLGARQATQHDDQEEKKKRGNDANNVNLYGIPPAGNQAAPSIQPRPAVNDSLSGPPLNAGGSGSVTNNYSFENPGYNHGLDSACLNQPLAESSNNVGSNQNLTIDEDFSFVDFLNENPDFFNI